MNRDRAQQGELDLSEPSWGRNQTPPGAVEAGAGLRDAIIGDFHDPALSWELHPGCSHTGGAGSSNLSLEFPKKHGPLLSLCPFPHSCIHPGAPTALKVQKNL